MQPRARCRGDWLFELSNKLPMKKDVTREGVVVVIDDDDSVRAVLKELLESVGLKVRLYASANAFQEDRIPDATSCLVLDVRLHETSGLKVQEELKRAEVHMPIVLITAYGDIPMPVRAMKAGAIDFLTEPFCSQDGGRCREQLAQYKIIIQAIGLACYYHLKRHLDPEPDPPTSMLTRREREVLDLVSDGLSAAEIGDFLNLSPRTVEWHIDKTMKKLGAKNRIQAVVLAIRDGLIAP